MFQLLCLKQSVMECMSSQVRHERFHVTCGRCSLSNSVALLAFVYGLEALEKNQGLPVIKTLLGNRSPMARVLDMEYNYDFVWTKCDSDLGTWTPPDMGSREWRFLPPRQCERMRDDDFMVLYLPCGLGTYLFKYVERDNDRGLVRFERRGQCEIIIVRTIKAHIVPLAALIAVAHDNVSFPFLWPLISYLHVHGHTVIPSMYAKVLSLEYSVMKHDIMFQCLMPSGRVVATFTWPKNYSLHAYYVVKKLRSYIASTLKTSQQNVIQLTGSKSNHVFKPQDGFNAAGLRPQVLHYRVYHAHLSHGSVVLGPAMYMIAFDKLDQLYMYCALHAYRS